MIYTPEEGVEVLGEEGGAFQGVVRQEVDPCIPADHTVEGQQAHPVHIVEEQHAHPDLIVEGLVLHPVHLIGEQESHLNN